MKDESHKRKSPADEITSPPLHQSSLGSKGETRAAKRQRTNDGAKRPSLHGDGRFRAVAESDPAIPSTSGESKQTAPPRPSPGSRPDDKAGHLVYELGGSVTPRYKILSKLGDGSWTGPHAPRVVTRGLPPQQGHHHHPLHCPLISPRGPASRSILHPRCSCAILVRAPAHAGCSNAAHGCPSLQGRLGGCWNAGTGRRSSMWRSR